MNLEMMDGFFAACRRGMGPSSHPASGYDKKTQAHDIAQVIDKLETALLLISPLLLMGFLLAVVTSERPFLCRLKRYDLSDRAFDITVAVEAAVSWLWGCTSLLPNSLLTR
jgi:hypothetical protein